MIWTLLIYLIFTFGLVSVLLAILVCCAIIRRRMSRRDASKLQKPNWEKDVVYLCQFPRVPHVRNISPFALKVRFYNTKHQK